jgi:hypothetical protein
VRLRRALGRRRAGRAHAGLASLPGQRLGDATPYALPLDGELIWFLCRFEQAAPVRVSLPADASQPERELLRRALRAWEQAGLGVRFAETSEPRAQIALEFVPDDAAFAAHAEADCRVERAALAGAAGERLPARLERARVGLRRAQLDWRGHRVPLDDAQRLGTALHELGHALGFQGHARRGDGVMLGNPEDVRDVGRALLAGERFRDPSVEALYRVASGSVVKRSRLPSGRSGPVDRLAALAAARGDGSLLARSGDRTGRVAFAAPDGALVRVFLRELPASLRDPRRLELAADAELLGAR